MEKILKSIQESLERIVKYAKVNPEEMMEVMAEFDEDLRDMADNCVPPTR